MAEICMRIALIALCIYNVCWSRRGPWSISKGDYSPPAFYLAYVFFASLATIGFMVRFFLKANTDLWVLLSLSLPIVTAVLGVIGHRNGSSLKARQFYSLYAALPEALAITELTKLDPVAGAALAEQAWAQIREHAKARL